MSLWDWAVSVDFKIDGRTAFVGLECHARTWGVEVSLHVPEYGGGWLQVGLGPFLLSAGLLPEASPDDDDVPFADRVTMDECDECLS